MDPAKLGERFKMTSFDPSAMTEMHRKNIEAIARITSYNVCYTKLLRYKGGIEGVLRN